MQLLFQNSLVATKNIIMKRLLVLCLTLLISSNFIAQTTELGTVKWMRDYDKAIEKANALGKPIFILFQEVPGCATCRNYGSNVLSEPLIVDAIESYFIPLAIYNNKGGEDAKILKKYNEPSWNNPVVRIVDHKGEPLAKRLAGSYSTDGLVNYMADAFPKTNQAIPHFLAYLQDAYTLNYHQVETVDFSMYCFWSGEGHLGSAQGVVSTEPGFKNGKEVVRVKYDPTKTNKKKLNKYAKKANLSLMDKAGEFRSDKDPQYYLKQSVYRYLALSVNQRTKINSMLANRENPSDILSPKQLAYLEYVKNIASAEVLYDQDFKTVWQKMDLM